MSPVGAFGKLAAAGFFEIRLSANEAVWNPDARANSRNAVEKKNIHPVEYSADVFRGNFSATTSNFHIHFRKKKINPGSAFGEVVYFDNVEVNYILNGLPKMCSIDEDDGFCRRSGTGFGL